MSTTRKQQRTGNQTIQTVLTFAVIAAVLAVVWLAFIGGSRIEGVNRDISADPAEALIVLKYLITDRAVWPAASTLILAGLVLLLGAGAGWWWARGRGRAAKRSRIDDRAVHLAHGKELESITVPGVQATADRLGVDGAPGMVIGDCVYDGKLLMSSWEDTRLTFAGPRTGKTTSFAIPAVLDAPGCSLATSNKPDLFFATFGPRSTDGRKVLGFDPQNLAGQKPTWWWNPLSYITDGRDDDTMDERADDLAGHFSAGSKDVGSKGDAQFDGAGESLLSQFLLAAALDDRPITDAYLWLTNPRDTTARQILTAQGFTIAAEDLQSTQNSSDKYRDSVYQTAKRMAVCLKNRRIRLWIERQGPSDNRPELKVADFVRSRDTLHALSREGKGTAGPLITALTVALCEAAEAYAVEQGGRLKVPFVTVLDEAANVCRWLQLPGLYSHYGSRGIVLDTYFQSWSQVVKVWGVEGAEMMKSATNILIYAGGVKEDGFLSSLVKLIGTFWTRRHNISTSAAGRNVSTSVEKEELFEVADLSAWPKGRALVWSSGNRATITKLRPWWTGAQADAVTASIKNNDPAAAETFADRAASEPEFDGTVAA
ncbi:type IV secretory system conjugative DNA transfer family protein [Plantibacter sp. CFBP 13570]|uniref:type IV secretory system conjugative DNA transfer family protein n=1 Tax=Plantibacter sp. CFBP 13570 TaxID=2775272 RepID=UPI001930B4B1|nr:TraM recognition domain-containing protein [Plantibacter sp. CFBP 13570]MBD8537121.1 type IV secretory system conjugative DNA transfer family protein [Plantibacter sp. CFBP 13570]